MNKQIIAEIQRAASEALSPLTKGFLDSSRSAHYLDISVRTFEGEVAPQIPSHRLNERGKRLFKKEDLDRFMREHRQAPATKQDINKLVDDVLRTVGAKGAR